MVQIEHLNFFEKNNPVTAQELNELELRFGHLMPSSYIELLRCADGFSLNNGIVIYSAQDCFERNVTFEVNVYAPGYVAIGDDSGGRSILINRSNLKVYSVDQGSMDPDDMEEVADSLESWVDNNCKI